MVNNGFSRGEALETVAAGKADLIAFGRPFISNPDLVRRLREDAPLNEMQATSSTAVAPRVTSIIRRWPTKRRFKHAVTGFCGHGVLFPKQKICLHTAAGCQRSHYSFSR
jgi:hypothetical protein